MTHSPNHRARQAFAGLLEGNARFVGDSPEHPNQDVHRRQSLTTTQTPQITLFGCSDSRVAAELIFDVGLGELFTVRTAGQATSTMALGSLEYGVEVLGTPLLVVLGHDSCGAVTAAKNSYETGQEPPGYISDIVAHILPSIVRGQSRGITDVDGLVKVNTSDVVTRLVERSTILRSAVDEDRLVIVGLTYHLADGLVSVAAQVGDEDCDYSTLRIQGPRADRTGETTADETDSDS